MRVSSEGIDEFPEIRSNPTGLLLLLLRRRPQFAAWVGTSQAPLYLMDQSIEAVARLREILPSHPDSPPVRDRLCRQPFPTRLRHP